MQKPPSPSYLASLLSADLITALTRLYPDVAPDPRASHTDMIVAAAQASVVRHLRQVLEEGQRNSLGMPTISRPR